MKHIPFAAFPLQERIALVELLERCGVKPRQVCASRMEPAATADEDGVPGFAMVSAPGWYRAYAGGDWIARLARDLDSLGAE